mgnify:CR=1 FL=1
MTEKEPHAGKEPHPSRRRDQNPATGSNGTEKAPTRILISPPNFQVIVLEVRGTAPLMVHRFSAKSLTKMRATQEAGSTAGKGVKRDKRDFEGDFQGARHISTEGWDGIHAAAFRAAAIDACRATGFQMTRAKMSIFVIPDGHDKEDGTPLVRIRGNAPVTDIRPARNDNGSIDLRARPRWDQWNVVLRIRYDADQFTATDVANLIERAGMQVGVGEGRPFSEDSYGMGFGTFTVRSDKDG